MFLSLIRAQDSADDRSVYGDFWFNPLSAMSASGMRVGPTQAMRLSTVYRCVRVLAATMASFPLCFRKQNGRDRELANDHPLWRVLAKKPNRFQSSFQWHMMMMGHLALRGTGYNRIIANGAGEIAELIPMHPDRTVVEVLDDAGRYRYRYRQADGSDEILPSGAVFKLMGLSDNGYTGLNPMQIGAESVGEGLAQQDYSSRFFRNDARPTGGWLEYPGQFKDDAARVAFKESWQKLQGGANRGGMAVLDRGMKYHELGVSNKDAQMLEARNAKVADLCRWLGVPPHLAFALDRATDNNIERLSLEFIKYTMREYAELFEAAYEDQLLDPDEGIEPEYDMDRLARGEMKTRGDFYQVGINGGWLTRNEARAMEGMNPLDELDEPLQPLNMVPAGTEPEPSPAPAAPANEDKSDDAEARAAALTSAIAGRVVRKEVVAIRKATAKPGQTNQGLQRFAAEFYRSHADYVAESLLCPKLIAAAWCDRQLAELRAAAAVLDGGAAGERVDALLEAWETTAAAELAARVQLSAQPPKEG